MSSKSTKAGGGAKSSSSTPMTSKAASRITSATARSTGGMVPKGSFASRAESAAARNGK